MPDIDVAEVAGRVIMQAAGELTVFSSDHPHAATAGFAAPDLDFNFRTFSGSVRTKLEPCIIDGDPEYSAQATYPSLMVIHGATNLALPSLGDGTEGGPGLRAEFRVCQTKLRQVAVQFKAYPPGISVGPSGMVLKGIDGTVFIDPEFVNITIGVDFQSADGATLTYGGADVTIDTRGYFELDGKVTLVGQFSLSGSLFVAWSPMDILQEAEISYLDWFVGDMRMHIWRGQGWGDPAAYPWQPDDNALHFTGVIGAHFTITEGRIGEFFGILLPPSDLVIRVEVSFGEFCVDDACAAYEWGVQGKVTVLEFGIGLFIGKSSDVDFMLGDQSRVLIDQAYGVSAAALSAVPSGPISDIGDGMPLDFDPAPLCPEAGGVATCTFVLPPTAGEMMVAVSWSEGTLPTPSLIAPDGTLNNAVGLTPTMDAASGALIYQTIAGGEVRFVVRGTMILYTIMNPQPGVWTLTLGNLIGAENYNVLFATNAPAPSINLTAPDNVDVGDVLDIAWEVTPGDTTATVQLAYIPESDYADYAADVAAGLPVTETAGRLSGPVIVAVVPASAGTAGWTPRGLAAGDYRVVARLDHPVHGPSYAVSPGWFRYSDSEPPAVPRDFTLRSEGDGLVAAWARNTDADLAFYEVVYTTPSLDTPDGTMERRLRIPPSDATMTHPTHERARLLGTMADMESTACVRAVDASGNASACTPEQAATPQVQAGLQLFGPPTLTQLTPIAGGFTVQWQPGLATDGSLLHWGGGCAANFDGPPAAQGATNLNVGNVDTFDITGLPAGAYRVAARGYRTVGKSTITRITTFSNVMTVVVTDNVDGDGDGLPDDWALRYGVSGAADDADGDDVKNAQERLQGTDPARADSDADGIADGDELVKWLTDPCDPTSLPDLSQYPQLVVSPAGTALRFSRAVNVANGQTRYVHVSALGSGELMWSATVSDPWIQLSETNGGPIKPNESPRSFAVTVDVGGLDPGYYTGHVRVEGTATSHVHQAVPVVPVRVWVLRPQVNVDTRAAGYVFLDANGNGVEDPGETTRLENVTVGLVSEFGVVMTSAERNANGEFFFARLPYADYGLAARHSAYAVTTPDPLPFTVSSAANVAGDLRIGMASIDVNGADQDDDGVPDHVEDVNANGNPDDDDTDGDGVPDLRDPDDDGDSLPTRTELTAGVHAAAVTAYVDTAYVDTDGDGLPDYRDPDDDGDGMPTIEEVCLRRHRP